MDLGKNIYAKLKTNNTIVISLIAFVSIVVISAFLFAFKVNSDAKNNTYAITEKGVLVPLERLNLKEDIIKQVKANCDLFVNYYYDLDGYTMKDKKEKIMWLIDDKQPKKVINDRDLKGYFNHFLSINGLIQHATIIQDSWKWSSIDEPYRVSFEVLITRINGDKKNYYKSKVVLTIIKVNRNYPFNPYGLLITNLKESFKKLNDSDLFEIKKVNPTQNNQN